jgi:hypothetical protein
MREDEAIRLAWNVVKTREVRITGIHSARHVSPARLVEEWLAKGASPSEIPAAFKGMPDHWIVQFKLKELPGERSIPDTIVVTVIDKSGKGCIRLSK